MSRLITSIFLILILVPVAFACMTARPHVVLTPQPMAEVDLSGPVYELPKARGSLIARAVSTLTDGVTTATHATVTVAADLPVHASHVPELALCTYCKGGEAANRGAIQAKQAAQEGMNGFQTVTSFILRIAYSSFSALVSGILRS